MDSLQCFETSAGMHKTGSNANERDWERPERKAGIGVKYT